MSNRFIFTFFLSHIFLALGIKSHAAFATTHALIVFGLLIYMVAKNKGADQIIPVMGYMVGSEVLWRLGGAIIFWEFAKYSTSFIIILLVVRDRNLSELSVKPIIYFLLLLPSIVILPGFNREDISFNLSGPITLGLCTAYFSTVKISWKQIQKVFIYLLAPIIGAGFLVLIGLSSIDYLEIRASSRIASAGYGPNQMSSILGLGALVSILYALLFSKQNNIKYIMFGIAAWLGIQCLLTFSRGGVWNFLLSLVPAILILIKSKKQRNIIIIGGLIASTALIFFVIPRLDTFTKGALTKRYESFETTGRIEIAIADLIAFSKNPIFGVGPGQSSYWHKLTFRLSSAHTEYTRMVAEHGMFGLAAIFLLIAMFLERYKANRPDNFKAISLAFSVWALLYLTHAAMRLMAPSFIFALGAIQFHDQGKDILKILIKHESIVRN